MNKKTKITLYLGYVLILVVGYVGIFTPLFTVASYYFFPSYPENKNETVNLPYLNNEVNLYFDKFGIPKSYFSLDAVHFLFYS